MLTLAEQKLQLESMTTNELVAYWNIMQTPMMSDDATKSQFKRHLPIVTRILNDREVPHEAGKLIWTLSNPKGY